MPRTDRSITILTGMIIAALYVILLVGFAQESYMRRDAASRAECAVGWPAIDDVSNRSAASSRRFARRCFPTERTADCVTSIEAVRRC